MTDKATLKQFFIQYYNEMNHLARTLLYDDEEAEDVVEDVFLRLMEQTVEVSPDKIRSYLLRSVHNGCMNRIRQKSVREQFQNLYCTETLAGERYAADVRLNYENVCDLADRCLTEPHLSIFRLRFEESMKLKEIASELDMNLKTVYKYLSQAIQTLQNHYRP